MAGSAELIKLVKQFRLLYDPSDENFTDEAKRDEAWTNIAMLINSTSKKSPPSTPADCNFALLSFQERKWNDNGRYWKVPSSNVRTGK